MFYNGYIRRLLSSLMFTESLKKWYWIDRHWCTKFKLE